MDESSSDSKHSPMAHSQDSVAEVSTLATTRTQMDSKTLLEEEDRQHVKGALVDRGDLAHTLRKTMRIGIENLEDSIQLRSDEISRETLDGNIVRAADESANCHIDDAELGNDSLSKPSLEEGVIQCEDFANSFCSPLNGKLSPGADYYSSKLLLHLFFLNQTRRRSARR